MNEYNGFILDLFEGDVEAIKSTEKALSNIHMNMMAFTVALMKYYDEKRKDINE